MTPLRIALIAAAVPLAVGGVLLAQPGIHAASCAASTIVPLRVDVLGKFTSSDLYVLSTLSGRRDAKDALSCYAAGARPHQAICGVAPPAAARPGPITAAPADGPAAVTGIGDAPAKSRSCL